MEQIDAILFKKHQGKLQKTILMSKIKNQNFSKFFKFFKKSHIYRYIGRGLARGGATLGRAGNTFSTKSDMNICPF